MELDNVSFLQMYRFSFSMRGTFARFWREWVSLGLRAGTGGSLPDAFAVVNATLNVQGGQLGEGTEAADELYERSQQRENCPK